MQRMTTRQITNPFFMCDVKFDDDILLFNDK